MTFCAYYPYSEPSDNISFESTGRWTILNYSVPTDISKQVDLLSARSEPYFPSNKPIVSMLFNHALTAIQFKTGANLPAGVTIKSISFKNIYFKGKHFIGTIIGEHAWAVDQTHKRDFTLNLNYISDGTAGKDITTQDNTFFLLPQALPDNAAVEVTMMINGQLKTLKKAINGKTWKQGEKIVYNLSSSKITQETFTLEAVATGTANYDGRGNISYSIKSIKTDWEGNKSFVPWTMEFSTDGGNNWTTNKPDFITLTTQENNGGTEAKNYTATFAPQVKTLGSTSAEILKAREIKNDLDLSYVDVLGNTMTQQSTANCYVIHNPGTYKFPTVYGNSIKNGADNKSAYTSTKSGSNILSPFLGAHGPITKPQIDGIANACLIWQDTENLISNISYTADGYVHFSVDKATIHNGNAIIAVRDNSNTILWSWHIWVTEEDLTPVEITNHDGYKYNILPINLGWCGMNAKIYPQREVKIRIKQQNSSKTVDLAFNQKGHSEGDRKDGNCTFYQWGRKDPMLPGNGISDVDKTCFTTEDQYQFAYQGHGEPLNTTEINEYIRNPHKFNINGSMDGQYYNLWSTDNDKTVPNDDVVIKSVYDPSPVGYSLPASNAFTGFTTTGGNTGNSSEYNVLGGFNKGWYFYTKPNKQGETVFFPACGYRYYGAGSLSTVTAAYGWYWVAGPNSWNSSRCLLFRSGFVRPLLGSNRSGGFSVRCAKEQD